MSLYSLTKPPIWQSNPSGGNDYIATESGWVNAETGEIVVAIGDLAARQNSGTSIIEYAHIGNPTHVLYKAGDTLTINVGYSMLVTVTGTPRIALQFGAGSTVYANYSAGTGTSVLSFSYTIASSDKGALTITSPIALNSGTIKDSVSGNNSPLAFSAPSTSGLTFDGLTPAVSSAAVTGTAFTTGNPIPVVLTFNDAVNVTGVPTIPLHINAENVTAAYSSGSGTTALTFKYTVVGGDAATAGQFTTGTAISLNGGTISNAVGTSATLTFSAPTTSAVTVN